MFNNDNLYEDNDTITTLEEKKTKVVSLREDSIKSGDFEQASVYREEEKKLNAKIFNINDQKTTNEVTEIILKNFGNLTEDEKKELEKRKIKGDKHKLKKDNIFIKNNIEDEDEYYDSDFVKPNPRSYYNDYTDQMKDEFNFNTNMELQEYVYRTLKEKTNYSFPSVKRKPSKPKFNEYFEILITNKSNPDFLNHEIFLELSYYFVNTSSKDNSSSINKYFELLDKKWAVLIMNELINKTNKKRLLQYVNEINKEVKCD